MSYQESIVLCPYVVLLFVYTADLSIRTYWGLEDVKLTPQSTSPSDVTIKIVKEINYFEKSITFKVSI